MWRFKDLEDLEDDLIVKFIKRSVCSQFFSAVR